MYEYVVIRKYLPPFSEQHRGSIRHMAICTYT